MSNSLTVTHWPQIVSSFHSDFKCVNATPSLALPALIFLLNFIYFYYLLPEFSALQPTLENKPKVTFQCRFTLALSFFQVNNSSINNYYQSLFCFFASLIRFFYWWIPSSSDEQVGLSQITDHIWLFGLFWWGG